MVLKYSEYENSYALLRNLIAPYGIEIYAVDTRLEIPVTNLIAPYGIEIEKTKIPLLFRSGNLIAPYGIEINPKGSSTSAKYQI